MDPETAVKRRYWQGVYFLIFYAISQPQHSGRNHMKAFFSLISSLIAIFFLSCFVNVITCGLFWSDSVEPEFKDGQKVVHETSGRIYEASLVRVYNDTVMYHCSPLVVEEGKLVSDDRSISERIEQSDLDRLMIKLPSLPLYGNVTHKETKQKGLVWERAQGFEEWHYKIRWNNKRTTEHLANDLLYHPVHQVERPRPTPPPRPYSGGYQLNYPSNESPKDSYYRRRSQDQLRSMTEQNKQIRDLFRQRASQTDASEFIELRGTAENALKLRKKGDIPFSFGLEPASSDNTRRIIIQTDSDKSPPPPGAYRLNLEDYKWDYKVVPVR